jgi:hypothetical protein
LILQIVGALVIIGLITFLVMHHKEQSAKARS